MNAWKHKFSGDPLMPYIPSIYIIRKLTSEWVINHRNFGLYKW